MDPLGYVLPAEAGEPTWFLDTRMTLKACGAQTGGAFTFLEWAAPAGFAPPRHVHRQEDEAFYLLEGHLDVECGDNRWTVGPGGFVFLPHGIPHAFIVSDGPVRGLQVTSPAGFENYIREEGPTRRTRRTTRPFHARRRPPPQSRPTLRPRHRLR